jgi:hypothetical protein
MNARNKLNMAYGNRNQLFTGMICLTIHPGGYRA